MLHKNTRFSRSYLEALTGLPAETQKAIAKEVVRSDDSVREVERKVAQAKEEIRKDEAFRKALEASKVKTCPELWEGRRRLPLRRPALLHLRVGIDADPSHSWNVSTGKTKRQEDDTEIQAEFGRARSEQQTTRAQGPAQYVRTTHSQEEFARAFAALVEELIPRLDSVHDIEVKGTIGGNRPGSPSTHGSRATASTSTTRRRGRRSPSTSSRRSIPWRPSRTTGRS